MKTRTSVPIILCLLWGACLSPVAAAESAAPLSPPVFSLPAGWYRSAINLSLEGGDPGAKIYYTLDGSEPTTDSLPYKGPIGIASRSREPNALSNQRTAIQQTRPPGPVFKGTVVRARAFFEKQKSVIVTRTYFIDEKGPARYSFPVISISTNAANLFDYNTGIYTPGRKYDELLDASKPEWEREANYTQTGEDWERPGYMEFFEPDGTPGFAQTIGIRIHGGATRASAQKTLRIYARETEVDPKSFKYEIFPGLAMPATDKPINQFRRFLLRTSGNDWVSTLFRDGLMQKLVEGTALPLQAFRPSIVFINGEYWGIHNIRERIDEYYLQGRYGTDKDEVVILENNGIIDVGKEGDDIHYRETIQYLREHDITRPEVLAWMGTRIDMDNFIDYQIAQIYYANHDWPGNNVRLWRYRAKAGGYDPNGGWKDGRWRWILYDTDFGFSLYNGPSGYNHPTLAFATQAGGPEWPNPDWSTFLLRTLLRNTEFKTRFINRFADLVNTAFEPGKVIATIDGFEKTYAPEIPEHIFRWQTHKSAEEWRGNVQALRVFAKYRPAAIRGQIEKHFSVTARVIEVSAAAGGTVMVNSVGFGEGVFSGTYFTGIPLALTATPDRGYRFAGWEVSDPAAVGPKAGLSDQTLSLTLPAGKKLRIEAKFLRTGPLT